MKKIRIFIIILQIFIALGAFGGAYGFISDSTGQSMGMTTTILKDTPFRDFLIPGIILLLVNGMGSTLGALLFLFKHFTAPFFAMLLGFALITWIIVQMNMVEFFWLQLPIETGWSPFLYELLLFRPGPRSAFRPCFLLVL